MISDDYWNWNHPFSQAEKRKELERDRDCFRTRAESDAALEAQGRFKKTNETTVVGATPVTYPRLPSGPWSEGDPGAPDPATDQLGYGIDEQEAVLPASSADLSDSGDAGDAPTPPVASPGRVGKGEGRSSPSAFPQPSRKSFRRRF
jgi:hypothetical protein